MSECLPVNQTPLESYLAEIVHGLHDVDDTLANLFHLENCPDELLPWLAAALSADKWASIPIDHRRSYLRSALFIHRTKGTVGALKRMLTALGYEPEISQWFEHGGAPHTFRVQAIGFTNAHLALGLREQVRKAIAAVKPVRSHFELGFTVKAQQITHLGAHARMGGTIRTLALKPTDQLARAASTVSAISRRGGVHHTKGLAA